jgi:hypothetical protein
MLYNGKPMRKLIKLLAIASFVLTQAELVVKAGVLKELVEVDAAQRRQEEIDRIKKQEAYKQELLQTRVVEKKQTPPPPPPAPVAVIAPAPPPPPATPPPKVLLNHVKNLSQKLSFGLPEEGQSILGSPIFLTNITESLPSGSVMRVISSVSHPASNFFICVAEERKA